MTTNEDTARWIYGFSDADPSLTSLLGGKGAALAAMTAAGIAVPPGFIVTTEAARQFQANGGNLPANLKTMLRGAIADLETTAGKEFGGLQNPLLVSVRSGAAVSMPGMMDTVLNLGLNDTTAQALAAATSNEPFAYKTYDRFLRNFGEIVLGIGRDLLPLASAPVESLDQVDKVKHAILQHEPTGVPEDPYDQLQLAVAAVFDSWNNSRARRYRQLHGISEDLQTAVTIQAMVFGNTGATSGTGVLFTRNPNSGEPDLYGEYLPDAQGEDVVAGLRTPLPLDELGQRLPAVFDELTDIARRLERRYRDMQDLEFTVEHGKLWMLQTRAGKRAASAAVRIAVDLVDEGLITIPEAIGRVDPERIAELLHPVVVNSPTDQVLARGLPASPGGASGKVVFDANTAQSRAEQGEDVVLVRKETSPDDFHGIVAANGIVTSRGGVTSHAAVVARGLGKTCIVGCDALEIDYHSRSCSFGDTTLREGDWVTVDGTAGRVFLGRLETECPATDQYFETLMSWADECRSIEVRVNADTPREAEIGRTHGAEGIGLCRTEHMFFEGSRIDAMRDMIMATDADAREVALDRIEPGLVHDFEGLFEAMEGLPVTIRLLDPPLHEFLADRQQAIHELVDFKLSLARARDLREIDQLLSKINDTQHLVDHLERLEEFNPMLGHRGCRLGITTPEITRMQARAIATAAVRCTQRDIMVLLEVMVPFVAFHSEFVHQVSIIRQEMDAVFEQAETNVEYSVGTMIELPRAALTAAEIATHADFFSFGTNDLTQSTVGLSRDDASRFLPQYLDENILEVDPFQTVDVAGVGRLIEIAIHEGRSARPNIKTGVCGEHGGDPASVAFFHNVGVDYVSCSPYRVPVARMAAAHAALAASRIGGAR